VASDHGGDGEVVARALGLDPADVVDLSMSLNPFAPDVAAVVARHLDAVRRYPDATHATLAAAETLGVDPARLVLTNGGSEAIALVSVALGGTVAREPEFSLHPRSETGPTWRSNPHNPTGVLASPDERAGVWDEAFYPLATGHWTRGDAGTVVVGSLTKVFACPGLRIGYVLADDVDALTAAQPAWPINGLAVAVLPELLAATDLPAWRDAIAARRSELAGIFSGLGWIVHAADAPWILVEDRPPPGRPGLRARLALHGIVVRDCESFGLPDTFRVAVPDDRGLARLADVLPTVTE
jgi:histidinol-phosphate/aromatic aminotransferase/cobyric acid decarboxylase-like protein